MADFAALVYEIDSSQTRTAATDLAKMNQASVVAAKGQESLSGAIRDAQGRFRSSADVAQQYGAEVYDLASKYNHALKAVYDFQKTEEELSRAVALGVISKRQSAEIMERMKREAAATAVGLANVTRSSRLLTTALGGLRTAAGSVVGQLSLMATAALSFRAIGTTLSGFEKSMASVQAVTKATTADMAAMRDMAKDLGATTEFTASQAAEGLRFLGMAGFTTRQSLEAIPAVLDLSTAAAMDLGRAADISSNMMSAFGIAASEAASVADVLAAASSRANTDVTQMGDGMKYVGPVAAAMGVSINDTAAAIGTLSDAGIQGSMAGTGLRRVFSSLANVTPKANKAIKSLGLDISQLNPTTNDLVDIVDKLSAAGLDAATALTIFGDRGGPAILALVENNAKLRDLTDGLKDVEGEAARMANTMRDNLAGDFDTLKAAAEGLIIALGDAGVTAVLRGLVSGAAALVSGLGTLVDGIGKITSSGTKLAQILAVLAATRLPALLASSVAASSGMSLMTAQFVAGAAASRATSLAMAAQAVAARGLGAAMALAGGPVGLVAAGVATLGMVLYNTTQRSKEFQRQQEESLKAVKVEAEGLTQAYADLGTAYMNFAFTQNKVHAAATVQAADIAIKKNEEILSGLLAQRNLMQAQISFQKEAGVRASERARLETELANIQTLINQRQQENADTARQRNEAQQRLNVLVATERDLYGDMNEAQRESYDLSIKTEATMQARLQLLQVEARYGSDSLEYKKAQLQQEREIELVKLAQARADAEGNAEAVKAVDNAIAATNALYDSVNMTTEWAHRMADVKREVALIAQAVAAIGGQAISLAANEIELKALKAGQTRAQAARQAAYHKEDAELQQRVAKYTETYDAITAAQMTTVDMAIHHRKRQVQEELAIEREAAAERERLEKKSGRGGAAAERKAASELKAAQKGFQSLRELMEQDSMFQVAEYEKRQSQLEVALSKRLITQEQYLTLESQLKQMYFGTEYERQQLQYDMDLEQLKAHLEAKRITQEQYDAMSTAAKWGQINQELDLNSTKWGAELNGLATHMGQLNEMAGSGYDKLLKAQRVFGAASALISAYTGAAEALKLPFPANIAAAAKVLATGMGFVNAIKSGGKSGGASAGSSSAAIQTKQEPTRNVLIRLEGSDFMVDLAESMLEQIYESSKDGRVIIARDY